MKITLLRFLCFGLFASISMSSCKKTETIELPEQAVNKILSYQITNVSGDPIKGSINQEKKTITVYLPFSSYLTTLQPEIKVSEGAKVNPESGTMIENLMDVFDNGRDIKYTVTGKDGSTATYSLNLVVQQPAFTLTEVSTSVANPTEYTNPTFDDGSISISWTGALPSLNRDLDFELIKVTFTDAQGKNYVLNNNSRTGYPLSATATGATIYFNSFGEKLPTGIYYIKIRFYSKTVALQYPIKLTNLKV